MRKRVITALFIIGIFLLGYFAFDGAALKFLLIFCLLIAFMEIDYALDLLTLTLDPKHCHPHFAFCYQSVILMIAGFTTLFMSREEIALVLCTSMLADVSAFAVGSLIGRHKVKFLAKISASKSYEGFAGGILIGIVAAYLVCVLTGIPITPRIVAYIALGGLTAAIGDLLGSATKRQLGVKDSGVLLANLHIFKLVEAPMRGHGGYLDRFDSVSLGLALYGLLMLIF